MPSASPKVEVVIRQASSSTGWDSVWSWLLTPLPENEEAAAGGISTDSGEAPSSPQKEGKDAF